MSYVTHVLIQGVRDSEIEPLNKWLRENDPREQQLRPVTMDEAGGYKSYVVDVWAASFNYLPSGFLEKLRDPGTWGTAVLLVGVLIHGEDVDEGFVFDKVDGQYQPVTAQAFRY